jgi:hypothetical protein
VTPIQAMYPRLRFVFHVESSKRGYHERFHSVVRDTSQLHAYAAPFPVQKNAFVSEHKEYLSKDLSQKPKETMNTVNRWPNYRSGHTVQIPRWPNKFVGFLRDLDQSLKRRRIRIRVLDEGRPLGRSLPSGRCF